MEDIVHEEVGFVNREFESIIQNFSSLSISTRFLWLRQP